MTPSPDATPIPPRQYMWYVTFWHVVYLGVLALFLGQVIIAVIREGLSWQSASLMGALLLQAGLYLRIVVFARTWPLSLRQLAAYFGGTLILWFIEWRMEPNFFWLVMSYFGQIYGIAPPPVAIPGSALIFLFVAGESIDWQLARVNGWQAFGWLMGWASFTVLFLFIYHLGNTSEQRAKLIRDLQAAQKELAAARERDAELAALWERERLARDLHDSLGHALVALSVQLEAIQRLYKVDPERASEQVDELKTLTRQSMDDLRRSLAGLRAPGLGDKPLSQSLRVLSVETGQRTGLRVECRVADEADQLSPALAETLWRVAQESLINVGRHAHAREVQIDLQLHPQAVLLRVWDDGVGLPPKAADLPGHYGLRGMRERVEGLGGALTVDSNGQGTVVEARLPLIAEPAQTASSPPGD